MIISFFGQMASGKDVSADYLFNQINTDNSWKRIAFANAVKNVFCDSFNVNRNFIEEWKRCSECPPGFLLPIRQSLQFIGDGFRKIQNDIWIDIALREAGNLLISDGRYLNEAKEISSRSGINVVLYRPGYVNDDPNPSEAQIRPISEFLNNNQDDGEILNYTKCPSELSYFNFFIRNDGSIEDLYVKINNKLIPFIKEKIKQ